MLANAAHLEIAPIKVPELNGFKAGQRVTGQDVEASPPRIYEGSISSVWSDGTAVVKWAGGFPIEADRHLVVNGHVDLHHLRCAA
ncbi:hypothetical protein ACV229_36600 [Burkholderia sp. MR1-5-21]